MGQGLGKAGEGRVRVRSGAASSPQCGGRRLEGRPGSQVSSTLVRRLKPKHTVLQFSSLLLLLTTLPCLSASPSMPPPSSLSVTLFLSFSLTPPILSLSLSLSHSLTHSLSLSLSLSLSGSLPFALRSGSRSGPTGPVEWCMLGKGGAAY